MLTSIVVKSVVQICLRNLGIVSIQDCHGVIHGSHPSMALLNTLGSRGGLWRFSSNFCMWNPLVESLLSCGRLSHFVWGYLNALRNVPCLTLTHHRGRIVGLVMGMVAAGQVFSCLNENLTTFCGGRVFLRKTITIRQLFLNPIQVKFCYSLSCWSQCHSLCFFVFFINFGCKCAYLLVDTSFFTFCEHRSLSFR